MYQLDVLTIRSARASGKTGAWPRVSRTVWLLGLTSLFTDVSSEMVNSVLPIYLVLHLGLSPLQFGLVDGLYQGVTALVRLAGGIIADRGKRHKHVAAAGYSLSAVCKLGLLAVGNVWTALSVVIALDRTGKGLRTAPRDAMISLSSEPERLGTSFGVHRALDAAGALIGPVVAFGVLALVADGFDVVFVISFLVALIGVAILGLFVPADAGTVAGGTTASWRTTLGLMRDGRVRAVVIVGALLSMVTVSDGFLYLLLQRRGAVSPAMVPLLYVGTALFFLALAAPVGRLADRVGRGYVFLVGHALALGIYAVLLFSGSSDRPTLFLLMLLLGGYYAATDGVLAALVSGIVPSELRASGLALLATVTSLGRLFASLLAGAIWTWQGPDRLMLVFAVAMLGSIAAGSQVFARTRRAGADANTASI